MPIKEVYRKNPELYKQKSRDYRQRNWVAVYASIKAYRRRPEIHESMRKLGIDRRQNIKFSVLSIYSNGQPKCKCCGEKIIEFLTIDHINGGGRKHVSTKGIGSGTGLYYWLRRNNFPEGFQVLCMNCNFARRRGRLCPHAEKTLWQPKKKIEDD